MHAKNGNARLRESHHAPTDSFRPLIISSLSTHCTASAVQAAVRKGRRGSFGAALHEAGGEPCAGGNRSNRRGAAPRAPGRGWRRTRLAASRSPALHCFPVCRMFLLSCFDTCCKRAFHIFHMFKNNVPNFHDAK